MIRKIIDELYSLPDEHSAANAGGLLEDIRVCPTDWVERIEVPSSGSVLGPDAIVLKNGAYWIMLRAAYNSAELSCTGEETEHGTVWNVSLPFEIPKTRPSVTEWLRRYGNMPIVAIGVDRNGYGRLLGTKSEKMRMRFGLGVGKRKSKNAVGVEIYGAMTVPGLFVDAIDETVAYISATADAVTYREEHIAQELSGLLARLSSLENGLAWVNSQMFKVYTVDDTDRPQNGHIALPDDYSYNFDQGANLCYLYDLKKSNYLGKNIEIIGAFLNGIYLKSVVSNLLPENDDTGAFDCYVDIMNDETIVRFHSERVSLYDYKNIFHLIIKVSS